MALFMSGCGEKEADIQAAIKKEVPTYINQAPEKVTTTEDNLSFYLPEGAKVTTKQENNVAFETDNRDFVIFVNPVEPSDSRTNYEIIKEMNKDKKAFIDATFEPKGSFQYVYIVQGEKYEVSVGFGGVKVSTLVKNKKDLLEVVEQMIKVAKSVEVVGEKKVETKDEGTEQKEPNKKVAETKPKTEEK